MIYYLDTSACVAALTPEIGTERITVWRNAVGQQTLATSAWVHTEFCSALSTKVRTGSFTVEQRADALRLWGMFHEGCLVLEIVADSFMTAAEMTGQHTLGLRASDALHLAIARAAGCTLVTLDERMARAAPHVGVAVAAL